MKNSKPAESKLASEPLTWRSSFPNRNVYRFWQRGVAVFLHFIAIVFGRHIIFGIEGLLGRPAVPVSTANIT